jgi:transcriptional regulator with XRE-family HTH domain
MSIRLLPRRLVGQTIRGIRTRLGMSQADFARSLGVGDVREVGRWERGTTQPDYGTLAKIATMGVVDVLVFHEASEADARPQLTPGEASELGEILARMEALLADARRLVDRASNRTALDLLEAAGPPSPALLGEGSALVLDAEVRVETQPRARSRTASAGRRAGGSQARTRGSGTRKSGSANPGSSPGSSAGSSRSTGSTVKSSGSRSSSARAGGGSSSKGSRSPAGSASGSASSGGPPAGGASS